MTKDLKDGFIYCLSSYVINWFILNYIWTDMNGRPDEVHFLRCIILMLSPATLPMIIFGFLMIRVVEFFMLLV